MTRLLVSVLVAAASCAPALTRPELAEVALPASFATHAGPSSAELDPRVLFADPQLARLIDEALAHNHDLQIAVQRIAAARSSVASARGARLPQVGIGANASVRKYGDYTADGAGNATTDIRPGQRVPEHLPDFNFGLDATWEVDLWGRLGTLEGAAKARYLASVEGHRLVTTNVVAGVANAYYELLALDRVRAIAEATLARQTEQLAAAKAEKDAGRTTELAVAQFAAEVETARILDVTTRQQIVEVEHRLDLLLGRLPAEIRRDPAMLDREAPALAAGVPSDLLRRRPDLRAAELAVMAAKLDVAAARRAFYPRLQLSASVGYDAFDPRFLIDTPQSIAYNLAAGLFAPLVNRSGIRAAFALAEAEQLEAMVSYQAAILRAFLEVATDLADVDSAATVVAHHRDRTAQLASAVDAATALFQAGKATYLDVIVAQEHALAAELELVTAQRDQHLAAVRLYRALGGGWR